MPEQGDRVASGSSPFDGLPQWQRRPEVYEEYICQTCRKPSRYTRSYGVPLIVFALVFWFMRTERVFECPVCIRRRLRWSCLPRLLLATVGAPIILVWFAVLYFRSYSKLPYDDRR